MAAQDSAVLMVWDRKEFVEIGKYCEAPNDKQIW